MPPPTFILDWLSHWVRKVLLFATSYFVDFLLIVISFGWFFWVFTWSRQVTRKVGESTQKEILVCYRNAEPHFFAGQ